MTQTVKYRKCHCYGAPSSAAPLSVAYRAHIFLAPWPHRYWIKIWRTPSSIYFLAGHDSVKYICNQQYNAEIHSLSDQLEMKKNNNNKKTLKMPHSSRFPCKNESLCTARREAWEGEATWNRNPIQSSGALCGGSSPERRRGDGNGAHCGRESETNRHVSHVPSQRLQSTARLQTRCALSENVTGLKGRGRRGGHRGRKTHRNRRDRLLFWREGRKWSHHYSSVLFGCNVLIVYVLRECFLAFISYRRLRGMLLLTFGNFAHAHNDAVCCGRIIPLKWNQEISYY